MGDAVYVLQTERGQYFTSTLGPALPTLAAAVLWARECLRGSHEWRDGPVSPHTPDDAVIAAIIKRLDAGGEAGAWRMVEVGGSGEWQLETDA